ncbi:hypothetical protein GCM10010206_65700 [Streptomyces cinerochromogenes]|nr:hypothetical protein GCM10010206_65700 [Streptomyces cinerochromogenes]
MFLRAVQGNREVRYPNTAAPDHVGHHDAGTVDRLLDPSGGMLPVDQGEQAGPSALT